MGEALVMSTSFISSSPNIKTIQSLLAMVYEFINIQDSKVLIESILKQIPENDESIVRGRKLHSILVNFAKSVLSVQETETEQPCTISLPRAPNPRKVRVYIDGVFDLLHSGHLNAFRQAKTLGDVLVVGINSDEEVKKYKGIYPIYNEVERTELLKGCRWVDEVIVGTPYEVNIDFLDNVAKCDFATHGDDIIVSESGIDVYRECKVNNRLKTFKRTVAVSSSNTIKRLLDAIEMGRFKSANIGVEDKYIEYDENLLKFPKYSISSNKLIKFINKDSDYLLSSYTEYLNSCSLDPSLKKKIVYIDGCFDMFHIGHLRAIQKAKSLGNYLIVGIYDDEVVKSIKGEPFPFTNLLERALALLAMKDVDEIILGAPYLLTKTFIKTLCIDVVGCGIQSDKILYYKGPDPYSVPKEMGIFACFESGITWTTKDIIQRVSERKDTIQKNVDKRVFKEEVYYNICNNEERQVKEL